MSNARDSESRLDETAELGAFVEEFRADSKDLPALIGMLVVGTLVLAGIIGALIWKFVTRPQPRAITVENLVVGAVIVAVIVAYPFALRFFGKELKLMRRRYRLHEGGVALVDGDAISPVPWRDVRFAYGGSYTGKLLGVITVTHEESLLRFETTGGETVDLSEVIGRDRLVPLVGGAIHDAIRKRASASLKRNVEVDFGNLFLSPSGIRVEGKPASTFNMVVGFVLATVIVAAIMAAMYFYYRLGLGWTLGVGAFVAFVVFGMRSQQVIETGHIAWDEVRAIRPEWVTEGKASFYLLRILGSNEAKPLFAAPVPTIPNFRLFAELCAQFGKPIEEKT